MKRFQLPMAMLGLICVLGCPGCKTFTPPNWAKSWYTAEEPKIAESKFARPVRMAVIWTPALLNTTGQKPTRGFGGRIYFYDAENKAVPVEGQLIVYGYNDTQTRPDGKTPDRKYAFTPEQFTSHFSETELGASYSVWLPWDEVGGPQLDISLVPIFTATSGQLVVGESSRNLLPGPTTQNTATHFERLSVPATDMVQRAAYEQPVVASPPPQTALAFQETSIRVPSTLAEQLANAGPQMSATAQLAAIRSQRNATGAVTLPGTMPPVAAPMGSSPGRSLSAPSLSAPSLPAPSLSAPSLSAQRAAPPPGTPSNQPLARFLRPLHPAPSGPGLQPGPDPLRSPPFPSAQPSAPLASPMPGPQSGYSGF